MFIGLNLTGCAFLELSPASASVPTPTPATATAPVPTPTPKPASTRYEVMQDEINRLEKVLAEKDKLIHSQKIHQKGQAQELQEASNEVTRVQVKLHRLATKPSTASTIAEIEVAMERLKQKHVSAPNDQVLQEQAQRLLDAAAVFYTHNEYAAAMNYATQASEIINMLMDQNRKASKLGDYNIVKFHMPVVLRTKTGVNLRKKPDGDAVILGTLEKGTVVMANAYRGNWLHVQIEGESQGWLLSTLVEIQLNGNPQ